jgi:hypothetical protein
MSGFFSNLLMANSRHGEISLALSVRTPAIVDKRPRFLCGALRHGRLE